MDAPSTVTPLRLLLLRKLLMEQGSWEMGRFGVITGVLVGMVWGKGGLTWC